MNDKKVKALKKILEMWKKLDYLACLFVLIALFNLAGACATLNDLEKLHTYERIKETKQ